MPPRRRSAAADIAASSRVQRVQDSPEDTRNTYSGSNNTTRSSTHGVDSPLTPATSVSDGEQQQQQQQGDVKPKREPDADEPRFSVVVPPASAAAASTPAKPDISPSTLGKRKRRGVLVADSDEGGTQRASAVKKEEDDDDGDVTFVSARSSARSSTRRAAAPRKSYKEESDNNDDDDDDDDKPLFTGSRAVTKGKQRQLIDDEEAKAAFAIADEIRNYAFDSDDEPLATSAHVTDDDDEDDVKPLGRRRRAAPKTSRSALRGRSTGRGATTKAKAEDSQDEEDIEDDKGWESPAMSSDDEDFIPDPPHRRRRARHDYDYEDDESDLSDIDDDDDDDGASRFEELTGEGSSTAAATSGNTTGRGRYAEDLQYETAKQRRARIKSEKYAARLKKKPQLTHYQKTVQALEKQHPELRGVWESLAKQPTFNKKHKAEQPDGLTISLLPFQLEGLNWLKQQEQGEWKGGILADEMGMGKTIQMISLFLTDRKKPTLVVAPTVAIMQWRNEIAKYTSDFKVLVWHGASREADVSKLKKFDVILTSYAVLESSYRKQEVGFKRKGELLKEKSAVHSIEWHRIVLDEAHNIKDRATNTAKGAFALQGSYRWCLSGTPLQNRVGELYSMIRFLSGDPYAFYYCKRCPCKSLHWQFSNRRSCDKCGHTPMHHVCLWNIAILRPIQREGTSIGDGGVSFARLRTLLEKIMLRRTKLERADDMGLPPRTLVIRRDYFNEEEEDLYDSLYRDGARKFSTYIDAGTVLNNYSNIFTLLTRMRQLACHPDLVLRSKTGIANKLLGDAADSSIHLCRICAEEATDPIQSKCRHVFCRECVRNYLASAAQAGVEKPDCPYCHAVISIDLEQEALEEVQQHESRQGILAKIDLEKWRSSTKIEALVEELNNVRRDDSTIKSIVFSQFVNFLDLITFRLQRAGFKVCRLEGNMTPEARDRTIRYFMETPDVTVFLVSLKAGGVALNLTEASRVYLMDPWWNGAVSAQAMDRIHRLGQRRPIVIKQMIIQDSIEARMLELQEKKQNMVNATLANDDSAVGRLSVADLAFLFSL